MKKKIYQFRNLILLPLTLVITACPSTDPIEPTEPITTGGNNTVTDYSNDVARHVSTYYEYKDFYINVTFNSTLSSHVSGKEIKYGLLFGYNNDLCWRSYCKNFSGTTGTIKCPLFFDSDKYQFGNYATGTEKYIELKAKATSGQTLTQDEKSLLKDLAKDMANESTAKAAYRGKTFVEIDGVRYFVSYINL